LLLLNQNQYRRLIIITGIVTGIGPLSGLRLTGTPRVGGQHVNQLKDLDFATATTLCPKAVAQDNAGAAVAVHQTPTGGFFQLTIDPSGFAELGIEAKAGSATNIAFELPLLPSALG
jgi:hypothetical protein